MKKQTGSGSPVATQAGFWSSRFASGSVAVIFCLIILAANHCTRILAAPEYVWIEAESGKTSFPLKSNDWGRPSLLSGGAGIHVQVDDDRVDKEVSDGGILIQYSIRVPKAGHYEVWNRVGFEFVRSPFEWRIDGAEWSAAKPDDLTTDLMEVGFWVEVAWLKMGSIDLSEGSHRLEIRLAKSKDEHGKWKRLLYRSDVLCLHLGPFHPHSKWTPDQSGRTDADEAASSHVFTVAPARIGTRSSISLAGMWEIARDDEQSPGEVAEPMPQPPTDAFWSAIPVPSDKNKSRPDLLFAHRIWYRTRIFVPTEMAGRAFMVQFPGNNLNTTVFVNRVFCGFEKNPFAPFTVDVTPGIQPGTTNELWVGIRDAWYGRSADPRRPLKLRKTFNYPLQLFSDGFQDLDYPVWNCPQSGILTTPIFLAAGGPVDISDVFVKPSVSAKRLEADLSLRNHSKQAISGEIRWAAINPMTGETAHTFAPQPFQLLATHSASVKLAGEWADPERWWPDSPHLYVLRTTVVVDGKTLDELETTFGFREWKREGAKFTLNGVVWHLWADLIGVEGSPAEWLAAYRRTHQRTMRLSTAGQAGQETRWLGLEPAQALDFFDRNGVVVRRNTTLDGEKIGYQFSETDPVTKAAQDGFEGKLALMKNWRDQCVAQVRGERNHPSIQIWSVENEFSFINLINLLGNSPLMDQYEEWIAQTCRAVQEVDPTRSVMTDGGGAMKKNLLDVAGDHYVATLDSRYPDWAYEPFETGGGRGRWEWDRKRPRFIGEDFFATGINPADYAAWGGEITFLGKTATQNAVATCYRMLQEGYRWGGFYAGWHFWLGSEGGPKQWIANAPRAVLVRQWDWTFGSGESAIRSFGLFNDTPSHESFTFRRRLDMGGQEVFSKTTTHSVAPGQCEKFDESFLLPEASARREGTLTLSLFVDGKEVFSDAKEVSILPPIAMASQSKNGLGAWDPQGDIVSFLRSIGQNATTISSLDAVDPTVKTLVVGRDALTAAESTSTRLAVLASEGHSIIVLDQSFPLKYQALPAELELAPVNKRDDFGNSIPTAMGRTAFLEDPTHPALEGLRDKDFFTWGPGKWVFRNAYRKPTRGAKSLIQCGPRLEDSALIEVPIGRGVIFLSQLNLEGIHTGNAVGQRVLVNLMRVADSYSVESAAVTVRITEPGLQHAVDAIGLQYTSASNIAGTLTGNGRGIALVSATAEQLRWYASHMSELNAFWDRGGVLMLCGLDPDGLEAFDSIVGVPHLLRPFKRERVTFPPIKDPLTAGLATGDIVLSSGQRIFDWNADEYVSSDMFSYVVDLEDVAPFAKSDFPAFANIVNGFVGSDGWPLIIDFPFPTNGTPVEIHMELPREETLVEYTHDPSVNYNPTSRIALVFDDRDRVVYDLTPNGEAQTFEIVPPRKARKVTLQILNWLADPAKGPLVGIDNVSLRAMRSPEWHADVRPMLNVGGMVHYVRGNGGVVLCNLRFLDNETVPINRSKKRTILGTVLHNLKAPFSGGRTVIAGARLQQFPIDLHTKATTFKDERGCFGDKLRTLKALPSGEQIFCGIQYQIFELPTSPVPQLLMLGGNGIPGNLPAKIEGIPVQTQADALFFLHTARLDRRADSREKEEHKRFELCRYVVHYVDGQTVEIPVYSEINVDHYVQREPAAIPGAQLAWSSRFENSEDSAAVYSMQWNNPRPGTMIRSIDLVPGKDSERGVPTLIAITAVSAEAGPAPIPQK